MWLDVSMSSWHNFQENTEKFLQQWIYKLSMQYFHKNNYCLIQPRLTY